MSQQAPYRGDERVIVRLIALIVIFAGWLLMLSSSSTALQTGTAVVFGRITLNQFSPGTIRAEDFHIEREEWQQQSG